MKRIILLALIIFQISCTTKQEQPNDTETIEVDIYQTPAKQTDYIDDWNYVTLENKDGEALIGNITHFDINDKNILIISNGEDVFLYNRDGELISFFNRRGQGPNEYVEISDVQLCDDAIWILSRSSNNLIKYNLDGHGLKTFKMPDWYAAFLLTSDDKLLLSAGKNSKMPYDFILYDLKNEEIIGKMIPFAKSKGWPLTSKFRPFISRQQPGMGYFVNMFDYNIYTIDNDNNLKIVRSYSFNFPFNPTEYKDKSYDEISHDCFLKKGIESLGPACCSNNISLQSFQIIDNRLAKDFVYRYDSETGQGDLIDCTITEDFPFLALPPLAFYDGWYITALTPENIESIENKFGKKYVDGIDEDSNPVLFFHHFR